MSKKTTDENKVKSVVLEAFGNYDQIKVRSKAQGNKIDLQISNWNHNSASKQTRPAIC